MFTLAIKTFWELYCKRDKLWYCRYTLVPTHLRLEVIIQALKILSSNRLWCYRWLCLYMLIVKVFFNRGLFTQYYWNLTNYQDVSLFLPLILHLVFMPFKILSFGIAPCSVPIKGSESFPDITISVPQLLHRVAQAAVFLQY